MEMLWEALKVVAVVAATGLIAYGCIRAYRAFGKKSGDIGSVPNAAVPATLAAKEIAPVQREPEKVREYVPGPALSRTDDPFYAVVSGVIAQTLAAEGINPEGGFKITSIRTVMDPAAPKLTVKDSALYAVITAAIAQTLSYEGINPENGFVIQSVLPLS